MATNTKRPTHSSAMNPCLRVRLISERSERSSGVVLEDGSCMSVPFLNSYMNALSLGGSETSQHGNSTLLAGLPQEMLDHILSLLPFWDLESLADAYGEDVVRNDYLCRVRRETSAAMWAEEKNDHRSRDAKFENYARWPRAFPNENRTYWSGDTISNLHKNYLTLSTKLNCYCCLRSLPRECFSDKQATGARSLGHRMARSRVCMRCALKRGLWPTGTVLKVFKKTMIICPQCKKMVRVEPGYRRFGVCSAGCYSTIQSRWLTIQESRVEGVAVGISSEATDLQEGLQARDDEDSDEEELTRTRASRCRKCWAIDHTDRIADGTTGCGLCRTCEGQNLRMSGRRTS
jgi:hypothetical protein